MYTSVGPQFQFHLPTEDDRQWLTESLTEGIFTPDQAIAYAQDFNSTEPQFWFSRIYSRKVDNVRVAWILSKVAQPVINAVGIAVHPDLRGQGMSRVVVKENELWLIENSPWDIKKIIWSVDTSKFFIPTTGEFAGYYNDRSEIFLASEGMKVYVTDTRDIPRGQL